MTDAAATSDPAGARILAAAAARFAHEGFERTRLADVARDAGLAVGTIYLRHHDKAALLAAVLAGLEGRFATAMDAPDIWAVPWPARFAAVFAAVFELAMRDGSARHLMALSPYAGAEGWRRGDRIRAVIARHVSQGQAEGRFHTDLEPSFVAAITFGMVDGAMEAVMANTDLGPDGAVRHLAQAAERWLCLPPEGGISR